MPRETLTASFLKRYVLVKADSKMHTTSSD